jgi:hypothetical protein
MQAKTVGPLRHNVQTTGREKYRSFQKINEQCGDVIENKGLTFQGLYQGGNVVENKYTYGLIPGMS